MIKKPNDDATPLTWALFYASLGWAVFPIQPKSKASFYNYPEYANPETGNAYSWQYQATKDPARITRYWTEHPEANIGVATGTASDLYVLDLDKEKPATETNPGTKDGRFHMVNWEKANKVKINAETTPVQTTGSGGNQLFYKSATQVCGTHSQIYKGYGVDTRGEGGFCVLPPSIHPNGKRYRWKQAPGDFTPQEPNRALIEYFKGVKEPAAERIQPSNIEELPDTIGEGNRTGALISYIGHLVGKNPNLDEDLIKIIIEDINRKRCKPPLDNRALSREVFPAISRFKNREDPKETAPKIDNIGDYMNLATANYIDTFWDDPANLAEPIPTGYKRLDAQMDGGLYPGLYVIGALSTMGKTTFTLQMANQIAQSGRDILFFSLEMSRAELIAKSISNLTAVIEAAKSDQSVAEAIGADGLKNAQTARALTDPRRFRNFTAEGQRLVTAAKELYKKEYGGNLWIIEGEGNIGAEEIRDRVKLHKDLTGKTPLIFVDYLQILKSNDPRLSDKQRVDENVVALRRLARANNTVVFAISSLNRASYRDDIDMNAFKESGAIEYSSDGLLGLQPRNMGDTSEKSDLIKTTKRAQIRQLELRILKNRGGIADGTQQFYYTPAFNVFEDVRNDPAPTKAQKPARKQKGPSMTVINDKVNALLEKAGIPWLEEGVIPLGVNPFEDQ